MLDSLGSHLIFYCEYWSLLEGKKFRYIHAIYVFKFGMNYKRLASNLLIRRFLSHQLIFI
ncbi:hypothetical protein F7Q91_00180 [Vibrio chagasii]|uniref:Uncharacterized protein n=1 Tax=Vibrio chagasii TaxID=170679 RepID=A0A7V7NY63_9VIBR|nr:hypothetical protein F7Q91_00180 [Vibrio chagasii]